MVVVRTDRITDLASDTTKAYKVFMGKAVGEVAYHKIFSTLHGIYHDISQSDGKARVESKNV